MINATATVDEGDMLMLCAQMLSAGATLMVDVIVTLSTVEGTGWRLFI
jgi:hypothetical protein